MFVLKNDIKKKKAPGRDAGHRSPDWGCTKTPISNGNHQETKTSGNRILEVGGFLWLTGVDFLISSTFHKFLLKRGVLMHPHSGLLWPASLPGAFFVVNVTFEEKHDF